MKAKIIPSKCAGQVRIPPSKSMGHRAIICACLAPGRSVIRNVAYSQDIRATMEGMRKLGAAIREDGSTLVIDGIDGLDSLLQQEDMTVQCHESGSTLRFFIPVFSLTGRKVSFLGENRLMKRPQTVFEEIFTTQGLHYQHTDEQIAVKGSISAGEYEVCGSVSSQFISGLLFALPLLEVDSVIKIVPPFESASYVDLTVEMLSRFGIQISYRDPLTLTVRGGQRYKPCDYTIEGDYSQLGFFAVLGAINSGLRCVGLNTRSKQGDRVIIDILRRGNVRVDELEDGYYIHKNDIKGCEIDLADCPDLGPVLTVFAMYGEGRFRLYHAGRLRHKESDRIEAMESELRKLGVDISATKDEILIVGKRGYEGGVELCGHKDHRVVMSLAVAATVLDKPAVIHGAEAVAKSYPDFFRDLQNLHIQVECYD